MNRFTRHDTRCFLFNETSFCSFDWTFTVDWLTKSINNTTKECVTNRYAKQFVQTFYRHALAKFFTFTENNNTYTALFKVHRKTLSSIFELYHFTCHNVVKAVYLRDTVSVGNDFSCFINIYAEFKVFNTLFDN